MSRTGQFFVLHLKGVFVFQLIEMAAFESEGIPPHLEFGCARIV